MVTHNL